MVVRGSDPFGSNAPDTLPGAYTQDMRGRLTDSTRAAFRNATVTILERDGMTSFDTKGRNPGATAP